MAMWSTPSKLKDLFSGFEKYGHCGTRWFNPRHNVLIDDMDFDMHNGIRSLKGQQMVAEGSGIAMYENRFFPGLSDMVTGGTVKIRYPNGSDGECWSYHLTTLQGPMPLKSDKKQESTMVIGGPTGFDPWAKAAQSKGLSPVLGKDLPGPSEARLQDQDAKIEAQSQKIAAMENAIDQACPVMSFLMVYQWNASTDDLSGVVG